MGCLKGKKALVTGAEQGIGQAVARALAERGCDVAIHYYASKELAEENAKFAKSKGVTADVFHADLTKEQDAKDLVAAAAKFLGGIDILVNNVGDLVKRKYLNEIDLDFWKKVYDINVTSAMMVTRESLPYLEKNQDGASIINLASLAGRKGGHPGSLVYSTCKGAVLTWTKALSNELAPKGIRVNAVAPGLILGTRFHATHTSKESADETIRGIPLGRAGTPEDVARTIVFLASEYDGFITGATIDINGGIYCI
ncbi:MAG TPA: oxidoreductase [Lentisphaeria bacterium]|nr:MAG: oxidoreductase [Lentisphaerae bacterium GWF2_49_21]HBC88990.1 oxidoreductase [Lentisphaeria bacterium]